MILLQFIWLSVENCRVRYLKDKFLIGRYFLKSNSSLELSAIFPPCIVSCSIEPADILSRYVRIDRRRSYVPKICAHLFFFFSRWLERLAFLQQSVLSVLGNNFSRSFFKFLFSEWCPSLPSRCEILSRWHLVKQVWDRPRGFVEYPPSPLDCAPLHSFYRNN